MFAAQALVPVERDERMRIVRLLARAAAADPARRVVLKLRGSAGEAQTHLDLHPYPDLLAAAGPLPANLVVSTEPMSAALERAEGLVTVSSTAAIEAAARGVPVIAIDAFGVSDDLINTVFVGSGLFGSEDDVVARRLRRPAPSWLRENYFHDPADDDWLPRLRDLVARRREGALPVRDPGRRLGGRARDAWERRIALGSRDPSRSGVAVYAVGLPVRAVLRHVRALRARVSTARVDATRSVSAR